MSEKVVIKGTPDKVGAVAAHVAVQMLRLHPQIEHNNLYVDVVLTINGVEVSFRDAMTVFDAHMANVARLQAVEMLRSDAALKGISEALAGAQMRIKAAIDQLPHLNEKGEPMKK